MGDALLIGRQANRSFAGQVQVVDRLVYNGRLLKVPGQLQRDIGRLPRRVEFFQGRAHLLVQVSTLHPIQAVV